MRLEGARETCTRLHGIRSQMSLISYRVQQTLSQFLVFSKVLTVSIFALCFEKKSQLTNPATECTYNDEKNQNTKTFV